MNKLLPILALVPLLVLLGLVVLAALMDNLMAIIGFFVVVGSLASFLWGVDKLVN